MDQKNKKVEFQYIMPRWQFWFLNLVILPLGLGCILVNKKSSPPPPILPYLGWIIIAVWLVLAPVKARQFFRRDSKISFDTDHVEIPTEWRGIVRIPYKNITNMHFVYKNTVVIGIKLDVTQGKTLTILHDFFSNSGTFKEFVEVLQEKVPF
jgi:hypothetical protein